jgi:hypothetical protein
MSGAGIACCRVCGDPLTTGRDHDGWNVLEAYEWCPGCRLYESEYSYGTTRERVGVVEYTWTLDGNGPANWRELFEEARVLHADATARGMSQLLVHAYDPTLALALADRCCELGCALSEAFLRSGAKADAVG